MSDRNKLMRLCASLATEEDAGNAMEVLSLMKVLVKQAREDVKTGEQAVMAWMKANGITDLEVSEDIRYYVGTVKRTKILDLRATAEAILDATGGDLDAFCEALSANAIKPGHAKKLLGKAWGDHFDVTEELDLKTGKPKKALKLADKRYLKA